MEGSDAPDLNIGRSGHSRFAQEPAPTFLNVELDKPTGRIDDTLRLGLPATAAAEAMCKASGGIDGNTLSPPYGTCKVPGVDHLLLGGYCRHMIDTPLRIKDSGFFQPTSSQYYFKGTHKVWPKDP